MSDDLTREEELRLREYAEAGSLCRSYEQLSRTSLAIYIAFSAAVIAVIVNPGTELYARITLEVIGLVVTLFTLNVLTRVRLFYQCVCEES